MESKLHGVGKAAWYGAILGASPSKGARSPLLWNAVFREFRLNAAFGAYDVAEAELGLVVAQLRSDPRFLGGAVAIPYKSAIIPWLDEIEPEAQKIGAVNALYREGKKLVGANTDGQGAVSSLADFMGDSSWLLGKRVVVLGAGGAGKAVATYLAKGCGSHGVLWLWNRTEARAKSVVERLRGYSCAVKVLAQSEVGEVMSQADLLVNCTSVGSAGEMPAGAVRLLYELSTPLAVTDLPPGGENEGVGFASATGAIGTSVTASLRLLAKLPSHAVVFDIIYRPPITMLLKLAGSLGLRVFNGLGMNLEQAVIACHNALLGAGLWNAEWSKSQIRKIMLRVP